MAEKRRKEEEEHLPVLDGKEPPQSLESEQAVLGAMLMERDAIIVATGMLGPNDFYSGQHQELFTAMQAMFREDRPVDIVTLQAWFGPDAPVDSGYLGALLEAAPTAAAVKH
ncbi:unnamed protein product, partial [marine sediment metagenome]